MALSFQTTGKYTSENHQQAIDDGATIPVTYEARLSKFSIDEEKLDKQFEEIKNGIGNRDEDHFRVGEKAVIVEFEDTGIGISKENIRKIFDPFFTTKGPKGGTGLGLSVSRNILHMHKGLISAESQVGKGTKLTIILKTTERG